jgi:hypothetical protein
MSRRLVPILLVAVFAAIVGGVLWATAGSDEPERTTLVDELTGSYRGVAMGEMPDEIRHRLGPSAGDSGFSPAGQLPAEAGVPQAIPTGGSRPDILKYEDVAFLVGARGVYAFIITDETAATTRGVRIGDAMDDARRAYELGCIDVAGGESVLGRQEFYPSCRATLDERMRVWFGRDPIRSITVLSLRHLG